MLEMIGFQVLQFLRMIELTRNVCLLPIPELVREAYVCVHGTV